MTITKVLSDGDVFEHNGRQFLVNIIHDEGMGEPWKEHDGHGLISDWTRRGKQPGERVLYEDRGAYLFYDVQETIALATKDNWGLGDKETAELARKLGRTPTAREITAEAVERDFQRMREWCAGIWRWVGVKVTLLKADADAPDGYFKTKHSAAIWGIESDCEDYLTETAYELAEQLAD